MILMNYVKASDLSWFRVDSGFTQRTTIISKGYPVAVILDISDYRMLLAQAGPAHRDELNELNALEPQPHD
jgi:hypothetical protein